MSLKCILSQQSKKGSSNSAIELASIAVTSLPKKTTYISGESFDPDGMVVEASYNILGSPFTTVEVTGYTWTPRVLNDSTKNVTIEYAEGLQKVSTTVPVTVKHKLISISIEGPSQKTYEYGDSLNKEGLVITAHYSDGTSAEVYHRNISPTIFNTVTNNQIVTVTYDEEGIEVSGTFSVVVEKKKITSPSWNESQRLVYNTQEFNVSDSSYWNNYDLQYMTIGGDYRGTNANTYSATFTLKDVNYVWRESLNSEPLTKEWEINKANGSLSANPLSVEINADNYQEGVVVQIIRPGNGQISIDPTSVQGLTLTLNNSTGSNPTLVIKGDGETDIDNVDLRVACGEGTNYLAPQSIQISAPHSHL